MELIFVSQHALSEITNSTYMKRLKNHPSDNLTATANLSKFNFDK